MTSRRFNDQMGWSGREMPGAEATVGDLDQARHASRAHRALQGIGDFLLKLLDPYVRANSLDKPETQILALPTPWVPYPGRYVETMRWLANRYRW